MINRVECYGKEQEILLANTSTRQGKLTFPSAASGTHSHTGIQGKGQQVQELVGNGSYGKGRKGKEGIFHKQP